MLSPGCVIVEAPDSIWEIPDKNALSAQLETESEDIKNGNGGVVGICTKIVNVLLSAFILAILACSSGNREVTVVEPQKQQVLVTTEAQPGIMPTNTAIPARPPTNTSTPNTPAAPVPVPTTFVPAIDIRINADFTLTSVLCSDEQGPDCRKLRVGDDYLTTSMPAKGFLYSCDGPNPNAPGSTDSKITWINFVDKTWNFFRKLWLPQGTFSPGTGTYKETVVDNRRKIEINNLPVDGKIGDWPMTNYPQLTEIDRNPGIPASTSFSFTYSDKPSEASSPTCASLGEIGVTKNGVVIFNAADARGEDALAREIVDMFGGHPARSEYHYHFIPERLDNEILGDGHSGIVGYINDGFPIYGYKGEGGVEMSNDDLDQCHGHQHGTLGYHYHATIEYPYTIGCYMGTLR